jgi:hypothetical protein
MEIEGRIIVALPEVGGTSKSGNAWKKREYVLETKETYPKKVHFDFFGEKADQFPLAIGDEIKLSFDIESREYNGRWYTSIRGWKSEKLTGVPAQQVVQQPVQAGMSDSMVPPPPVVPQADSSDDLPF